MNGGRTAEKLRKKGRRMGRRGNGEGSIYQDSDRRWRAVVNCGMHNGKRQRKKLSGRTRAEVAEKLKKALRDQQQGLPLITERQSLSQFITRWLAEKIKPRRAYKTYTSYSQELMTHILPALGGVALNKLSAQDLDRYLTDKLALGLSPRTVQYHHAIIRCALNQALRWDLVPRNIATLVQPPVVPKHAVNPYTAAEAKAFLLAVQGHRLEAIYTVAVACGLRQGETLGLQWSDIDLECGQMNVRTQLQRDESRKLSLSKLKTDSSIRRIELPEVCVTALRMRREQQVQERQLAGTRWVQTGLVFTTRVGTGIDQRNLLRHYYTVAKAVGLRRIRYHDLRHTAASLLLALGVPMTAVRNILGHTDIRTTINIYGHVYDTDKKDAAGRMNTLLTAVAPGLAPEELNKLVN
jgi:integrase